jgi:transcription antitermination protein NusB
MAKATSSRRAARESALRILYTVDVGKQPTDEVVGEAREAHALDDAAATFAEKLVAGTLRNVQEIDKTLDRLATGFPTGRQTAVDRNILRLAAAEILFAVSDAPPGAVVNEAVELAKKYSTAESGRFVNGVLGALVREVGASPEVSPEQLREETGGETPEAEAAEEADANPDEEKTPDA